MHLAVLAAAWVLTSSFPQGKLYRLDAPGSDVVALRAEGRLRAPAWAVRQVLVRGWSYGGVSPYILEHRVLHAEGCAGGARELPGCKVVWAYEKFDPPFVGARDYVFRMEIAFDRLGEGGGFELRWELDDSHGAPPEGATHMRRNTGAWTVRADGEESRFSYRASMDPGGSIPAWVVNTANRSQVPSVIAAVEEEARKLAEARGTAEASSASSASAPPVGVPPSGGAPVAPARAGP